MTIKELRKEFLDNLHSIVEANSFEQMCLYKKNIIKKKN